MGKQKEYSVIIRCFNEEKHIARLLSGILEQTLRPKEIIVVDSGSTDATLSIVSHFPVKVLKISKEEFSFGRSLNIGCETATSQFLIIASGHVYPVYKDWAEQLLKPFDDEKVGLVYGKQRGSDSSFYSERRLLMKWFPEVSQNGQKHPFCNNANAAIRRRIWEEIKYNEELTGLEDLEWAKNITQKGYKIVYESKAEVIHVHNESYSQIFHRYYREAMALKRIYPEERFSRKEFVRLLISNIYSDSVAALKEKKFCRNIKDIIMFRLLQFLGTYRGFRSGNIEMNLLKDRFYYPSEKSNNHKSATDSDRLKIRYSEIIHKTDK